MLNAGALATLLTFAIPALGTNLLQSLSGSVSTLWVGRLLGPAALSATSNAHIFVGFLTSLLSGISTAAGLLIGRALGAAAPARAKAVVRSSIAMFVVISIPLAVAGWLLSADVVAMLAVPPEARPASVTYMRLLFLAMPAANILSLTIALLQGSGDTRAPLVATIVLVAIDAVLTPLLIAGAGRWDGWGIAGAGVAYGVANLAALALLSRMARRRMAAFALSLAELAARPDGAVVRWCLRAGTVVGVQFAVLSISSVALMGLVNRYGAHASAAYGVAVTIWGYVQLPALAVASAATVLAAHAAGARDWGRVREAVRVGSGLNLVVTGIAVIVSYGFCAPLAALFLPGEAATAALVVEICRPTLWGFLMFAVTMVMFGVLRAVNKVSVPLLIILLSHLAVRLPFAYLLTPEYGLTAIWWSYPVGLAVGLVLSATYVWRRPPWRPEEMPT